MSKNVIKTRTTASTRNTAKTRMPTARNGNALQDTTKNMRQEEERRSCNQVTNKGPCRLPV